VAASEEFVGAVVAKAAELGANYAARHSEFRHDVWERYLTGPLPVLIDGIGRQDMALVESYLHLVAEGIRLGLLPRPLKEGEPPRGFANLAFSRLVPELLPKLPKRRQAETLASIWNLSENLVASPRYLEAALCRSFALLTSLEGLEARLELLTSKILAPRLATMGATPKVVWMDLSKEDRRFLPGQVHFLNPVIACVHERTSSGVPSRRVATCGIWLTDPPVILGPAGCTEDPGPPKTEGAVHWRTLAERDVKFSEVLDTAVSESRGIASLVTSQWVALLLPPKET
jgi:hypothetical protein